MPVLALHFPWRRYHATPWGSYVNAQAVDIPPSPWRILRALYSAWKLRVPDLTDESVHSLLHHLATPPVYALPPYHIAHTRHYLPDTKHRTGAPSTDLALDTFAVLGNDATIRVHWSTPLPNEEFDALRRLAAALPYLGRADSLCDAHVEDAWNPPADHTAVPLDLDATLSPGQLHTDLLAPAFPLDLAALTKRPTEVRAAKRVFPPGSQLVPYAIPAPQTPTSRLRQRQSRRRSTTGPVTAVRLSLSGIPQPPVTETVAVTDALHNTCVSLLSEIRGKDQTEKLSLLAGRNADGTPLQTNHKHAHYLAVPSGKQIHELALWIPGGLHEDELAALARLPQRLLRIHARADHPQELHARVIAYGSATADGILPATITGASRVWVSQTPFLPAHHQQRRQSHENFLHATISKEFSYRPHLRHTHIHSIDVLSDPQWALYRRHRFTPHHQPDTTTKQPGRRNTARPAYGLRIEFSSPVTGPLSLGALSHYGLGLFQREDPDCCGVSK